MIPSFAEPVFLKHIDMVECIEVNTVTICRSINETLPDKAIAAQRIDMLWYIYMRDEQSRNKLIIDGFKLDSVVISAYSVNPYYASGNVTQTEKIVIKKLPLHVDNNVIINFLNQYPQIKSTSNILLGKGWDHQSNNLTEFYDGNRHLYVQSPVVPPLPKDIMLDNIPCKLWHKSQNNFCHRCFKIGHKTSNHSECDSYTDKVDGVLFRSYRDPLSNFYECKLEVEGRTFLSSEQYYQYLKCKKVSNDAVLTKVLASKTAAQAKAATACLSMQENETWSEFRNEAMYKVLKVKAEQISPFINALIDSGSSPLYEATSDKYWGCGVDLKFAKTTKPTAYPGENVLGLMLEKIRDDFLIKDVRPITDEVSGKQVDKTNSDCQDTFVLSTSKDNESLEICSPSKRKSRKKRKSKFSPIRRQNHVIQNYYSIEQYLKQTSKKRKTLGTSSSNAIL